MRDLNNKLITREAQGRSREAWSERSVYQTDELMDKNVIGGAENGRVGQGSQSPLGQIRCVNGAVVSGQYINLSGEASSGSLTGLIRSLRVGHVASSEQSTHSKLSVSASKGGDSTDRGVSKRHSSRGYEQGVAADGRPVR